jgi:hypothetical protein
MNKGFSDFNIDIAENLYRMNLLFYSQEDIQGCR